MSKSPSVVLIYTTFADRNQAEPVLAALLDARLIACANVFADMQAYYRWQGEMRSDGEAAVLLKTTSDQAEAAMARLAELHPYDTPAILLLPTQSVHAAFADWVGQETR